MEIIKNIFKNKLDANYLHEKLYKYKKKEFLQFLSEKKNINIAISESRENFLNESSGQEGYYLIFRFESFALNKKIILKQEVDFDVDNKGVPQDFQEIQNDFEEDELYALTQLLDKIYWESEEKRWTKKGWKKTK